MSSTEPCMLQIRKSSEWTSLWLRGNPGCCLIYLLLVFVPGSVNWQKVYISVLKACVRGGGQGEGIMFRCEDNNEPFRRPKGCCSADQTTTNVQTAPLNNKNNKKKNLIYTMKNRKWLHIYSLSNSSCCVSVVSVVALCKAYKHKLN